MKPEKDIVIPLELFDGHFDLLDVGAICVLLASPHLNKENLDKWSKNVTLAQVIEKLIADKIIVIEEDENGNKITTIHVEKMKNESSNTDVRNAIRELAKDYGFTDEDLNVIQSSMEEVAFSSYCKGYDDGRIDYAEPSFTGYGHKEDF